MRSSLITALTWVCVVGGAALGADRKVLPYHQNKEPGPAVFAAGRHGQNAASAGI